MHVQKSQCTGEFSREFFQVARRNGSISIKGVTAVFATLMLLALMIGVAFAMLGAWLILPFAGVEIAVLAVALWWIVQHAYDYEQIRLAGGMLEVEVADGRNRLTQQFNPVWARVVLQARGTETRVSVRSHGRDFEIGRYLNADDKRGLAQSLGAMGMRMG